MLWWTTCNNTHESGGSLVRIGSDWLSIGAQGVIEEEMYKIATCREKRVQRATGNVSENYGNV